MYIKEDCYSTVKIHLGRDWICDNHRIGEIYLSVCYTVLNDERRFHYDNGL